ncbi:hypothetical protein BGX38DRAFT_1169385, partial [Terfezia claveryi]
MRICILQASIPTSHTSMPSTLERSPTTSITRFTSPVKLSPTSLTHSNYLSAAYPIHQIQQSVCIMPYSP